MQSRWDDAEAARAVVRWGGLGGEAVALRVYTSRLLGADPTLVLHGGGNTSVKAPAREIDGSVVEALWIKGSGWDLGRIEPAGFPACRLRALVALAACESLSDEAMVAGLRSQMLDPSSPTPSVEALLHALLPAAWVDHTHANAVLAIVDQPDGGARAADLWGERFVVVPYVMPGFVLARRVAELLPRLAGACGMVLEKHGIFTWGATARESYERMIEAVDLAERAISRAHTAGKTAHAAPQRMDAAERRERQAALSPALRGALARAPDGRRFVVEWRDDAAILELLSRPDAEAQTSPGPVTPDHVIRTKPMPLFVGDPGDLDRALGAWARRYEAYFEAGCRARQTSPKRLDRLPRVVHVPGLGSACLGATLADARVAGDITAHTARVILDALAIGRYQPVRPLDLFDVEHWSLEQAKLGKAKPGALAGRIALVTGAASGIGRATAEHLLELGAHVVLSDRQAPLLDDAKSALAARFGSAVTSVHADLLEDGQAEAAVRAAVAAFGGLDLVVSNAGTAPGGLLHEPEGDRALAASLQLNLLSHQHVAKAAVRVMLEQGAGGCLLFNASKSSFAPGPEFGPYAVAKAALIALMRQYAIDLGRFGIRSSAVNADRIRTALFDGGVLEARARARGLTPDQYFQQNLLSRETTARDVALAFGWLSVAEATTGCVVTVDGGNPAAFPR